VDLLLSRVTAALVKGRPCDARLRTNRLHISIGTKPSIRDWQYVGLRNEDQVAYGGGYVPVLQFCLAAKRSHLLNGYTVEQRLSIIHSEPFSGNIASNVGIMRVHWSAGPWHNLCMWLVHGGVSSQWAYTRQDHLSSVGDL
jgi:hypothetical protein